MRESREETFSHEAESEPLVTWERIVSGSIGLMFGCGGTIAVFITDNQAGSVALLLIAGIFLTVGVNGTPLLAAKYGENELRLGRRRRQVLAEIAEKPPDVARQTLEALEKFEPSIRNSPPINAANGLAYERDLANNIHKIMEYSGSVLREDGPADNGVDLTLRSHDGLTCDVVVKFYPRGDVKISTARRIVEQVWSNRSVVPVLIISNARLTTLAAEFFAGVQNPFLRWATWQDASDNAALQGDLDAIFAAIRKQVAAKDGVNNPDGS